MATSVDFPRLKTIIATSNPKKKVSDEQVRKIGEFLLKLYALTD